MKEGYLQTKIREMDYKLKQQMELAELLEQKLERVLVSEKEHKRLLKRLKELDDFKNRITKDLTEKNRSEIQKVIGEIDEIINKKISEAREKIEMVRKEVKKMADKLKIIEEKLLKNSRDVSLNRQVCKLLMEELVNERVFSRERIEILSKRASIRAKKET
jgi:seryl-tRNA synthetase